MGTLAQKLAYLGETKAALRQAINDAGGSISADTPFRQYADWIRDQGATLWLDFANQNYYSKDAATHYPAGVGFDLITFTRSTGGGRRNAQGNFEWLPANTPRIDYDPVTGECRGLLIEEQRTRLNTISAAPSAAQSVAVSAVAHTISFYGAGSVVLSGAHVASLTGAGAYPARREVTFTPTAGTLTITPTGDVRMLQLEAGAFATSAIVGEGAQVTRAADIASVNELSPWYRADEGTLFVDVSGLKGTFATAFYLTRSTYVGLRMYAQSSGLWRTLLNTGDGTGDHVIDRGVSGNRIRAAYAYSSSALSVSANGNAAVSISPPQNMLAPLTLQLGRFNGGSFLNGHIRVLRFYPKALPDQLQAMTA